MDLHFRAFSFVDQIDSIESGVIQGRYFIPQSIGEFPLALVGEAIGQLAAWHAMSETDFEMRPMAGLAAKVSLLGDVHPGDTLELHAEISSLSQQAMSYGGHATLKGKDVLQLEGCVGPMLPVEQFDSPEDLRKRYAELLTGAATTGGFPGIPEPQMELTGATETKVEATFQVPDEAPYFADHFPRMPVVPGTLQIDVQQRLVQELLSRLPGGPWTPAYLASSKLRAFVPPGAALFMEATAQPVASGLEISMQTRHEGRTVGAARWYAVRGES